MKTTQIIQRPNLARATGAFRGMGLGAFSGSGVMGYAIPASIECDHNHVTVDTTWFRTPKFGKPNHFQRWRSAT